MAIFRDRNYVSSVDNFLKDFDQQDKAPRTELQTHEVKKHAAIFKKRDEKSEKKDDSKMWEEF